MGYHPPVKYFILDDDGNKIPCKKAASILKLEMAINTSNVRHYVRNRNAKTIQEIRDFKEKIRTEGKMCLMRKEINIHKTKFGDLTVKEIYAIHPYKDSIKITAISSRLHTHKGMSEKIWEPPVSLAANKITKKKKYCYNCGKDRKNKFFGLNPDNVDGLNELCINCNPDDENTIGPKIKKTKKKVLAVKPGTNIIHKGKKYKVVVCFKRRGMKADLTCNRVMDDGQVITRRSFYIEGNWSVA